MKLTVYFSHNASTRRNPKIQAMMIIYGTEGYGWFWILLELLREQPNYSYPFTNKYAFQILAKEMNCEPKQAEKFITDCIEEFQLFQTDGESFWNNTLKETMACMENKSMKAKEAADRKWNKKRQQDKIRDFNPSTVNANTMRMDNNSNAEGLLIKESKIEINKLNEIEKKEKTRDEKYFDFVLSFYSKHFLKLIKLNNPNIIDPNLSVWEEELMTLLNENDISFGDVELAMVHSQGNEFWTEKVVDICSLRKYFESIYKQVGIAGFDTTRKKDRFEQLMRLIINKFRFGTVANLGLNRFFNFPNELSDFENLPNVKELKSYLLNSRTNINSSEIKTSNPTPRKNVGLSSETECYLKKPDDLKTNHKGSKEKSEIKKEIIEPSFIFRDVNDDDERWDSSFDRLRGQEMPKYEIEYDDNGKPIFIQLADSMLKKVGLFFPFMN